MKKLILLLVVVFSLLFIVACSEKEDPLVKAQEEKVEQIEAFIDPSGFPDRMKTLFNQTLTQIKNSLYEAETVEQVNALYESGRASLQGILDAVNAQNAAYIEIENYVDRTGFSTELSAYFQGVINNYKDRVAESNTAHEAAHVVQQAKSSLDTLVAHNNGTTIDPDLCGPESVFDVCKPTIINLPSSNQLSVVRGFTGNITTEFNIRAIDFEGNDVTSLMSIEGTVDFATSGDYSIRFFAYDDNNNLRQSQVITFRVLPISTKPIIHASSAGSALTLTQAEQFNALDGLTAVDGIGIDLSTQITFEIRNQNDQVVTSIANPGYYKVFYSVKDMDNNTQNEITLTSTGGEQTPYQFREITVLPSSVVWSTDIETSFAQEPGLLYLMIDDVFTWEPKADDPYTGIGTIPLQPRMTGQGINPNAKSPLPGVAILDVFTPVNAAGVATFQGYHNYTVDYWQYVDVAVAWGGQIASFVIPSRDIINSAHRNGVPILGNIFMAPTAFGGTIGNTYKMLQKDAEGNFPIADKMIQMAKYFQFDGWFINLETDPGSTNLELAANFRDFLIYIQEQKDIHYPEMIIQNYDSLNINGRISWQGALNANNDLYFQNGDQVLSNSLFIDFRWDGRYGGSTTRIRESAQRAISLGRSPYELYTGFDTQQYGYVRSSGTNTPWQWNRFFDPETLIPYTSIGFYRTDWTFNRDGQPGGNIYEQYLQRASDFWVGFDGDPRNAFVDLVNNPNGWYGVASFIVERTTVMGEGFYTSFNTGNGKQYFKDGQQISNLTEGWSNLSVQDIQPHFRWVKDVHGAGTPMDIKFDYDDAYLGGTSLVISGELTGNNNTDFKVYKTYLDVFENTKLDLRYKVNSLAADVAVKLTFEQGETWYEDTVYLTLSPTQADAWLLETLDLSLYAGKKITSIGFAVGAENPVNYKVNFGELNLHRQEQTDDYDAQINGFTIVQSGFQFARRADMRLTWAPVVLEHLNDSILYRVYHENSLGELQYLGASYHNFLYVKNIERLVKNDGSNISDYDVSGKLVLRAYDKVNRVVGESQLTFDWPEAIAGGRIEIIASKTVVKTQETLTLTANISQITDSVLWELPGATLVTGTLTSPQVTVRYENQGVYPVKLSTFNILGSNSYQVDYAITVSNIAANVSNLTGNARIHSFSGFNPTRPDEHPRYMIDGNLATKWCETDATTTGNKWIIVDLRGQFFISEVILYHADNDPAYRNTRIWNTRGYEVYISTNLEDWVMVAKVTDNVAATTSHAFTPIQGRYVRIIVTQGSQIDNHSRIQELEVFGRV